MKEAGSLEDRAAEFTAATGIPLSYVVVINEDAQGNPPDAADAAAFDEAAGSLGIPVTADPTDRVRSSTPWTGVYRPGKCVLSPEMVMLSCYTGPDDAAALDLIQAHAAAR